MSGPASLATQSAKRVEHTFHSPNARFILRHDPTALQEARSAELAALKASGRIMGHDDTGRTAVNYGAKVDGARLETYDPATRLVTVRVDHSTLLDFHLTLEIPLGQLEEWLGYQIDGDDEGDNIDMDHNSENEYHSQ